MMTLRPFPALLAAAALSFLAACGSDETISGQADREATYVLEAIDGVPFPARATIRFPEPGVIAGESPCNSYTGVQTAPYPWFDSGEIVTTQRACLNDDGSEGQFFSMLARMRLAEVNGPVLLLTDSRQSSPMLFRAEN